MTIILNQASCVTQQKNVPEHGKRFAAATGDQRHLNALASNLVTVQTTDSADCLLQGQHLNCGLQLIVSVGAKLHSFHLDKTSYTPRRCFETVVNLISNTICANNLITKRKHSISKDFFYTLQFVKQEGTGIFELYINHYNNLTGMGLTRPYLEKVSCSVCCRSLRDIL